MLVFIDNGHHGFAQFASALRRRGITVAGISYPLPMKRVRRNLFAFLNFLTYGQWRVATDGSTLTKQISKLNIHEIEDVMCGEFHLDEVISAATQVGLPTSTIDKLLHRRFWADKTTSYTELRNAGVSVPDFLVDVEPTHAAEILGFPLVVKSRRGNGGYGVRIVSQLSELRAAVESLREQGWGVMYEQFVEGASLCYVAAFKNGEVLRQGVYHFAHGEGGRTLPSARSQTVHRDDVVKVGEQIVASVGGSDMINVDLIDSPTLGLVAVDVNLRVWGNIVALNAAQAFFDRPYLQLLGHDAYADPWRDIAPNIEVDMFPNTIEEDILDGRYRSAVRQSLSSFRNYRHWTDWRYLAAGGVTLALRLGAGLFKQARMERTKKPTKQVQQYVHEP